MPTSGRDHGDEPLFIVDNSEGGRSGIDYLSQWSEIAKSIDIATGYFEIGALLALDGDWQRFDKLRILMGDEVSGRTKKALLKAVRERALTELDRSIDESKSSDPFLTGADAITEALQGEEPQIECRVYAKDKFHAKAYITHSRIEAVGSQALVGSSNFTHPGLTQNVELNIRLESSSEVNQLQGWFEKHWADAEPVTDDILKVVQRHTREFTPFEVYARSLQALVARHELTDTIWEETESKMFGKLDRYQQEGYWNLVEIAKQHGGALLCDGVGLGKTFIGLMLIERLVKHENKRVALFAPKAVKDAVWTPVLKEYLPKIGGFDGSADYSSLSVFSHTDLSRVSENMPERLERVAELADVVIIDEAHHFRNRGQRGDEENPEKRSRYWRMSDLVGDSGKKSLFMLTATPINNSLNDFRHLIELFSREQDDYFASTLGINSVSGHLRTIKKSLDEHIGADANLGENADAAQRVLLEESELFKGLVVQRSRKYAKESQILQTGQSAAFPTRETPKVAGYSIRKGYGDLLDLLDESFGKANPLFTLAIYYPLAYYTGDNEDIDPLEEGRQKQVVGLIRTNFLKRFESSAYAFERSCDRLLKKLLAFLEVNAETDAERSRLEKWKRRHADILDYAAQRQLELWDENGAPSEEDEDEDIIPPELLSEAEVLSRDEYDVVEIIQETYNDLDQVISLLAQSRKAQDAEDDKVKALTKLLKSKAMKGHKVLVFTEFADTARYIRSHLEEAGIEGIEQIDSGRKVDRAEVIRRFAPYYNGSSSAEIEDAGKDEIEVLIATDVLAEGLNLQDATRLVNYDIHWNPVRLMQRIGRVDRRLNPDVEERIKTDHPEDAATRGTIAFWNFLPPDELDSLLKLYNRVHQKTLVISATLGIEEGQLLKPDDEYDPIKLLNAEYEGTNTGQEELKLEYERLIADIPGLEEQLRALPSGIFSGRGDSPGGDGTFFCFELPALDVEEGEFTLEAGITRWYLSDRGTGEIIDDPAKIAQWIRSEPPTPRVVESERAQLSEARDSVRRHIKNSYEKKLNAPQGVPIRLVGWMDVSRG